MKKLLKEEKVGVQKTNIVPVDMSEKGPACPCFSLQKQVEFLITNLK